MVVINKTIIIIIVTTAMTIVTTIIIIGCCGMPNMGLCSPICFILEEQTIQVNDDVEDVGDTAVKVAKLDKYPKIIFAEMGCIHIGPNYIKRQCDSGNFLTFWYTLIMMLMMMMMMMMMAIVMMLLIVPRLGVRLSDSQQRNKNWRIFYALCNEV